MGSISLKSAGLGLLLAAIAAGCGPDPNSPEMGAVPAKPNPGMISKLPPQIQEQMKAANRGMQSQAAEMGQKAKALHGARSNG